MTPEEKARQDAERKKAREEKIQKLGIKNGSTFKFRGEEVYVVSIERTSRLSCKILDPVDDEEKNKYKIVYPALLPDDLKIGDRNDF